MNPGIARMCASGQRPKALEMPLHLDTETGGFVNFASVGTVARITASSKATTSQMAGQGSALEDLGSCVCACGPQTKTGICRLGQGQ